MRQADNPDSQAAAQAAALDARLYFDCSSPWTYLGFVEALRMERRLGLQLSLRPILVGGLFNTINPSVYAARENPVPVKAAYSRKDLADWARLRGLEIHWPTVFPVNSVKAMRACLVLEQDRQKMVDWALAVFAAYWGQGRDISQDQELLQIAQSLGQDGPQLLQQAGADPIKAALRAHTQDLAQLGGFGSPSLVICGQGEPDLYFGNDRLVLAEARLRQLLGQPA